MSQRSRLAARWGGYGHSVLLGVAMGVANLLGYIVVMALSRPLGPAQFGGYAALSTFGVVLAIPAGAFQVLIASRVRPRDGSAGATAAELPTSGLRAAGLVGGLSALATIACAVPLREIFHLQSAWSPILLGLTLLPMSWTGCAQGILLGRSRLRALSVLYLTTAGTRVVAAVLCAATSASVTQVFAAMLLAAWVTCGVGLWLCRRELHELSSRAPRLLPHLLRSNGTLAGYILLTNIDALFARHFLTQHESGGYALALTFGRAICWGTQFVALLVIPRLGGSAAGGARTTLRASGIVLAIGAAGFAAVAIAPSFWLRVAGGGAYAGYGNLALWCVVLGTGWAVVQVWLFSEMAAGSAALGATTWAVVAAECLVIGLFAHDSAGQIIGVCLIGVAVIVVAGLLRFARQRPAVPASDLVAAHSTSTPHQ